MFKERRVEPREVLALPLWLPDGRAAVTRDLSSSGMYLVIQGERLIGGVLFFEMRVPGARIRFSAEGLIVRVERRDGYTGVALKLISPRLEALA